MAGVTILKPNVLPLRFGCLRGGFTNAGEAGSDIMFVLGGCRIGRDAVFTARPKADALEVSTANPLRFLGFL